MTASRFGFLYEQSGQQLLAKVIVANDPQATSFTAQQQVDLIATSAVAKGASQRATISLSSGKFALLCVPYTITGQPPSALALLLGPERAAFVEPTFTVLHLITQLFVRRAFGEFTPCCCNGASTKPPFSLIFSAGSPRPKNSGKE